MSRDAGEADPDLGQGEVDEQDLDDERRAPDERHVEARDREDDRVRESRPSAPMMAKTTAIAIERPRRRS
jgi:hypothetical protein